VRNRDGAALLFLLACWRCDGADASSQLVWDLLGGAEDGCLLLDPMALAKAAATRSNKIYK